MFIVGEEWSEVRYSMGIFFYIYGWYLQMFRFLYLILSVFSNLRPRLKGLLGYRWYEGKDSSVHRKDEAVMEWGYRGGDGGVTKWSEYE